MTKIGKHSLLIADLFCISCANFFALLSLSGAASIHSNHLTREAEEDSEIMDMGSGNSTLSPEADEPVLSASAIANIICSGLAIIFLSAILCYLVHSFNVNERKMRLRTTKENNRRIDRQIAAAKARAEQRIKEANERAQITGEDTSTLNIFEESGPDGAKAPPTDDIPLLVGVEHSGEHTTSSAETRARDTHTEVVVDLTGEEVPQIEEHRT